MPQFSFSRSFAIKTLPETKHALVLRTDFSNHSVWDSVCAAISEPVGEFGATVDCVSDPKFGGFTVAEIVELASRRHERTFLFIVDQITILDKEHPVLVIDLDEEPGRYCRVIPREVWGVENNLSTANMDFDEFVDGLDADGVFRGFRLS